MDALGMIEVVGLVAGIEAADVACKTANVELVGYELARGGGYVTIKVLGQVGAVNAAVTAGVQAAEKISRVISKLVIPRPNTQVSPLICSTATVGWQPDGSNVVGPPIEESQLAPTPTHTITPVEPIESDSSMKKQPETISEAKKQPVRTNMKGNN